MDSLIPAATKAAPGLFKALYTDLAQPGVQVLGKMLARSIEFCSIPILGMGYLTDSVKMNLAHRLNEYARKLEKVPEDKKCEVNPEIGAPILNHLQYTTNDEIADLFTTLLAKASNFDTLDQTHPSFAHLISRLSVDEARIVKFLKDNDIIHYCTFLAIIKDGYHKSFITVQHHATLLPFSVELIFPENIQAYLSNLIGLGILIDKHGMFKNEENIYDEICEKYDYKTMKTEYLQQDYKDVMVEKSFYEVTPFGRLFIDACIKD